MSYVYTKFDVFVQILRVKSIIKKYLSKGHCGVDFIKNRVLPLADTMHPSIYYYSHYFVCNQSVLGLLLKPIT